MKHSLLRLSILALLLTITTTCFAYDFEVDGIYYNILSNTEKTVEVTHDWKYDAEIVQSVKVPVIVAGGLGPDNVEECIRQVKPAGVDSLTKTTWKYNDGVMEKDIPKVAEFCQRADKAAKEAGLL
jgi:phosphoribosylanthranilate isomerase